MRRYHPVHQGCIRTNSAKQTHSDEITAIDAELEQGTNTRECSYRQAMNEEPDSPEEKSARWIQAAIEEDSVIFRGDSLQKQTAPRLMSRRRTHNIPR